MSIGGIQALNFRGTWNADTNTPTLASGVGDQGDYFVVGTDGATGLDGITDWVARDWATFNGSIWQKVDNTEPAGLPPIGPAGGGLNSTYPDPGVDGMTAGVLTDDAAHGVRGGGTQHADVVAAGASGFLTGADKTKLNGLAVTPNGSVWFTSGAGGAPLGDALNFFYDNPTNQLRLGATDGGSLALGVNPATGGIIALTSNTQIAYRNDVSTANVIFGSVNAINRVVLGSTANTTDLLLDVGSGSRIQLRANGAVQTSVFSSTSQRFGAPIIEFATALLAPSIGQQVNGTPGATGQPLSISPQAMTGGGGTTGGPLNLDGAAGDTPGVIALNANSGSNVGIGTAAPNRLLEVSGAGNRFLRVTSTDASQTGIELFRPGAGNTDWRMLNDGGSLFLKASVDDFTNTITQFAVRLGGNSLLNPTTVDVSKITVRTIRSSNNNGEGVGFSFVHDTSNGNVGAAIIHERTGSTSQGKLHFATKDSTVAAADIPIAMTIDENQLVGIGTVTPDELLHTAKAVNGDAVLALFENSQTNSAASVNETAQFRFGFGGNNDVARIVAGKEQDYTSGANEDSFLAFYTDLNGVATEGMRLDSAGDVTIAGIAVASNLKIHALIENRSPTQDETSTSFVTLESSASITFSGRPVLISLHTSLFTSGGTSSTAVEFAIQIDSGSDVLIARFPINVVSVNDPVTGELRITPSAGSHVIRLRWRRSAGDRNLRMDSNNQILVHGIEL